MRVQVRAGEGERRRGRPVLGGFGGVGEEEAGFGLDDQVGGGVVAGGDKGVAFDGAGEILAGEALVDDVAVGLDEGGGGAGGLGGVIEPDEGDVVIGGLA